MCRLIVTGIFLIVFFIGCTCKNERSTVVINVIDILEVIDKEYAFVRDSLDEFIYISNVVRMIDGNLSGKFYIDVDSESINGKMIKIVDSKSVKDSLMNKLYDLSISKESDEDFILVRRGVRSDMLSKYYVNKEDLAYGFNEFRLKETHQGYTIVGYDVGLEIIID